MTPSTSRQSADALLGGEKAQNNYLHGQSQDTTTIEPATTLSDP